MKCDRCDKTMEPGEERMLHGQQVCEDCYMDLLSPTRPCDPWATMAAKSASQLAEGEEYLTDRQQRILQTLQQGPMSLEDLAEKSGLEITELERDLATLHHMEKVGGRMAGGQKIFQLWTSKDGENDDAA